MVEQIPSLHLPKGIEHSPEQQKLWEVFQQLKVGIDPREVINKQIKNSWQSVLEILQLKDPTYVSPISDDKKWSFISPRKKLEGRRKHERQLDERCRYEERAINQNGVLFNEWSD